jgi:hypothetical protein
MDAYHLLTNLGELDGADWVLTMVFETTELKIGESLPNHGSTAVSY